MSDKPIIKIPPEVDTREMDVGPLITFDEMLAAVAKIAMALQLASGEHVDTGAGLGGADLWVKLNGVEYYLHMKAQDRAMTDQLREKVEQYIRDLKWSGHETDWDRTLVAGNIRTFTTFLEPLVRAATLEEVAKWSAERSVKWLDCGADPSLTDVLDSIAAHCRTLARGGRDG